MMAPGDEKVVAERLFAVLSTPPRVEEKPKAPPAADLTGTWDVRIEYAASVSTHRLARAAARATTSTAPTRATSSPATCGARSTATTVRIRSSWRAHGDSLNYTFTGTVTGDEMAGDVSLGEYLDARFSAKRHAAGRA